jgi:hypothetical protein
LSGLRPAANVKFVLACDTAKALQHNCFYALRATQQYFATLEVAAACAFMPQACVIVEIKT